MKDFTKKTFNEWFSMTLRNELDSRKEVENIAIIFLISAMKPLRASLLMDCYEIVIFILGKAYNLVREQLGREKRWRMVYPLPRHRNKHTVELM